MTIIETLLEEIGTSNLYEQIRTICDKIYDEEKDNFNHLDLIPKFSNVLLTLEIPEKLEKRISFVCLEREGPEEYVVSLYSKFIQEDSPFKKTKTWVIKEHKAEKIIKEFAKIYKFLKGE